MKSKYLNLVTKIFSASSYVDHSFPIQKGILRVEWSSKKSSSQGWLENLSSKYLSAVNYGRFGCKAHFVTDVLDNVQTF